MRYILFEFVRASDPFASRRVDVRVYGVTKSIFFRFRRIGALFNRSIHAFARERSRERTLARSHLVVVDESACIIYSASVLPPAGRSARAVAVAADSNRASSSPV